MATDDITVTIEEEQRQMLLLALAKLSIERPGWHWTLGELAAKYSRGFRSVTAPDLEDGRVLFESFRTIHAPDRRRQAVISVHLECEEGCPVHVRYIDEHGEAWDHGYAELDDLDLRREIGEWLAPTPKPYAAPFAGLPETPSRDRKLLAWRDRARGLPRKE